MRQTPPIIDLAAEIAAGDSLRLTNLARRFDVAVSTCFRWVIRGLPTGDGVRVKLEALKRGKTWITSEAAVARFFAALPRSETTPSTAPIRTPAERVRESRRAAAALREKFDM